MKKSNIVRLPFKANSLLASLLKSLLLLGLSATYPFSIAISAENVSVRNTADNQITIANTVIGSAQDWSLTGEEWEIYQKLMTGFSQKWYSNLPPPEVLGLNAKNEEERRHFADLSAQIEHEKIARELAFNTAFHEAMVRRYGNEPVIKSFDLSAFNPAKNAKYQPKNSTISLMAGDHVVLFIDTTASGDFLLIPTLLNLLHTHTGVYLDIYCMASVTDTAIQVWAKINNIPMTLVNKGVITLNRDQGKFQAIFESGLLPQVILVHQGQSQKVLLTNLR